MKFWPRVIMVLSAVLVGAVAFLILGPRPEGTAGMLDVSALPTVNASFNAAAAVAMCVGVALIKGGNLAAHRKAMMAAFGFSAAFLVSYVIYHWFKAGPRPYTGEFKAVYLIILFSHIILAAGIMPLILMTLYRGYIDDRPGHRKLAKYTFPLWLYVSVTGVVIYFMLYGST